MKTAEELNKYINDFTEIYVDGKEENTIPDVLCYVYCDGGIGENGFAETEIDQYDLGINFLIAKSWITKDKFNSLCK